MKYYNIKRYKFSTFIKKIVGLLDNVLSPIKFISLRKIKYYLSDAKYAFKNSIKYIRSRNFKIPKISIRINLKRNKFLLYHLPSSIIFFAFLYIAIPTFYDYDKADIQKQICKINNVKCIIKGKVTYNFFPTPQLKIKNLDINIVSNNTKTLATVKNTKLKLSFKNLLAKEKHKITKIIFHDFESNINLNQINYYNSIFKNKIKSVPIFFTKGKIIFNNKKKYIATINDANLTADFLETSSKAKLKGKFLNNDIILNLGNEINDGKSETKIEIKIKNLNFLSKIDFLNLDKNLKNGKFLIKHNRNKISGIFDYKNNEITVLKSNARNAFVDGKLRGKIAFSPFFDFNIDLNLNSINFTKLYNYFLSLDEKKQKELFRINNRFNGKLNLSAEKIYSKNNLIKSFESRVKFYNGNVKIEQFLINLGKLGAADILGSIDNDLESSNFKFESNVFVDNSKKFLSKFGIYNKEKIPTSLFIQGNIDLQNIRASFYEISDNKKFKAEDINFIESEFNDMMLENGFADLFNFQKFKVFLKSVRDDNN